MIVIQARAPFADEWTRAAIVGANEGELINMLASRLESAGYEVNIQQEDGSLIEFAEYLWVDPLDWEEDHS